jgi:hypothetical protein
MIKGVKYYLDSFHHVSSLFDRRQSERLMGRLMRLDFGQIPRSSGLFEASNVNFYRLIKF